MESDPLMREGAQLDLAERAAIEAEVEAEIATAFTFAERSPVPAAAALWTDV
jgi:hypothetical protein